MFKHCWRYAVTSASTLAEQPVKAEIPQDAAAAVSITKVFACWLAEQVNAA
jgi:hypothetical protein